MLIRTHIDNQMCLLSLCGDFDASSTHTSRPELETLCKRTDFNSLQIDMSEVGFLDSSGVGALVYLFKRLTANNISIEICQVQGQPAELMRLLRLDQAMLIHWSTSNTGIERSVSA